MALSLDDVERLVGLMTKSKVSLIEYDGVKIVKNVHEMPKEKNPKTLSEDELLFDPFKDITR